MSPEVRGRKPRKINFNSNAYTAPRSGEMTPREVLAREYFIQKDAHAHYARRVEALEAEIAYSKERAAQAEHLMEMLKDELS